MVIDLLLHYAVECQLSECVLFDNVSQPMPNQSPSTTFGIRTTFDGKSTACFHCCFILMLGSFNKFPEIGLTGCH